MEVSNFVYQQLAARLQRLAWSTMAVQLLSYSPDPLMTRTFEREKWASRTDAIRTAFIITQMSRHRDTLPALVRTAFEKRGQAAHASESLRIALRRFEEPGGQAYQLFANYE